MSEDPDFDTLCQANDARRKASSADHSDEIEMLQRALRNPHAYSLYSPAGLRTMRQRLQVLTEEIERLQKKEAA